MIAFAVLTGPLPKAGVIVVAALSGVVLLHPDARARAAAMLGALVLAPALLLADIWHSPQLASVHRHPLLALAAAALVLGVVAGVAVVVSRHAALFAVLALIALPFRVPIEAGGTTSNLLVPLYFVVAAGALAFLVPALSGSHPEPLRRPGWVERLLALFVCLYAIQSIYSSDFERALQNMVFFYVPFALLFALLARVEWSRPLLRICLQVVAGMAVVFCGVAFIEYATRTIILNPKLVVQNDLHTYFVVNSVFFDADIFGRFLALVMVMLASVLLYEASRRQRLAATAVLAVLWCGLVLTLSRSSLAALLAGLATLLALRWRVSRTLPVVCGVIVAGVVAVAVSPTTFGINQGLNGVSSGRGSLISGGIDLFGDRPLWGYGSGSFESEYHSHNPGSGSLTASHTIPITIAAEQGLIGELAYLALLFAALVTLLRGARGDPARAAVGAAFVALVFHTLLYADFLEDPFTWALLGVGTTLAVAAGERGGMPSRSERLAAIAA